MQNANENLEKRRKTLKKTDFTRYSAHNIYYLSNLNKYDTFRHLKFWQNDGIIKTERKRKGESNGKVREVRDMVITYL